MGATDGEVSAADARPSEEAETAPVQDTLAVPVTKRRKVKSPTPGTLRGRSATPIRGRSQTPFNLYLTRRSATPSTWRSITPFINREQREKTPFELGRDIKTQITCNKAVFDQALIMDITESEEIQKPVRYITTDMSVIDRAAVMDVSNVEVIYLIEEYEEAEEEEIIEEVKPKKKAKGARKARTPRKSIERDAGSATSETEGDYGERDGGAADEREDSVDIDEFDEPIKKTKKKAAPKKKEKKEKSPSPKLTLKLEMGGGQKASKKMFEEQEKAAVAAAAPKPPPKKSKLVLQMEEQARQAAKAAEEEAVKAASKPKGETFAERQARLKKEKEEQERIEAELRAALRAQKEAEQAEEEETEQDEEAGEEEDDGGDESFAGTESYGGDYADEGGSEYRDEEEGEEVDVVPDLPKPKKRRGSNDSEEFTRPNPYDEERWKRIAEEEGEEFMQQMRKYSMRIHKSEKERDAEWQRIREQARLPHFIVFPTDRTVEAGHSVRISCAVGGPELSVKWFKDGRQLERDAKHRIINNNNILVLEVVSTTILDSGEYSCVVANSNDTVTASCYVTIYEVFKDEPAPPSCKLIKEYYHLRDDELTIECHLHGVPRPTVVWLKGGIEIKPSFKFTMLEEAHGVYKLRIYKPNDRDGGTYICKAVNSSGEMQISHHVEVAKNRHFHARGIFHARDRLQKDIELTAKKAMAEAMQSKSASDRKRTSDAAELRERVHRASPEPLVSPKQKLKFATQLRDRMALEGSTVRFVCTVIGPSPTCRWMKDDKYVVVGPTIKNLSEEGKAILELSKITSESSGVYKCIAKNEHSEIDTQCYFKVYSAQADGDEQEPIFALPLRDVYHSSQNDLIIDTKVRGNPRPKITWVKDNLPVVLDDRRVQIEHLDGVCELIINKPTSNDSGVYTCLAENKLGSQKTTHTVVVDVVQSSRRSSLLSNQMTESDNEAGAGEAGGKKADRRGSRLPKGKKKEDEAEAGTYERRSRIPDPSPKQQLYFIANISNRYVPISSKVKFQAVVGGPDATFKWQKDEQNVTYGPRIRNMSREGHACLEFVNTLPEDSGVYTLIAQNEFCKITTSALLHVYSTKVSSDVEPMFTRSLKEIYHIQTNELILETAVRGVPTPKIQWIKDNFEIKNGGRTQILQHQDGTCELIIDRPDAKDSGKYVVYAENSAGKAELLHTVHFEGRAWHIADNIHGVFHADKSLLRPKTVEEEKPAPAAKEEAGEGDEGDEKDAKGRRKSKVKKPKKEEEDTNASATDFASDAGSLKKREKVIGIHFATSVRDRVVAEGSKVKISCFLESKEPQVKWFKNDEQITNSPKIRGRHMEGLCTLEITSATAEDSGVYKCWARDETGQASTFCKLEVYADPGTGDVPPTFTRNIKDTYHGKINELQLDVHVRGLPTPTVTWVKDGVKVEPSEKYQQIDHDDGLSELFIMDPVPADSGKYVCQAENREGKAEITHNVTVEPRYRRPVSPSREARPPVKPQTDEEEKAAGEVDGEEKKKKKKPKGDEETGSSRREAPPPPDLKKYLYLRNFLSNRTVKAGSNVKWMVNIDGPEPTARWFHGDQPITFGPKSKMSCQDGIAWLNLVGVTEEEAGEYTLKVRGPENEVVSTCQLFVYTTGVEELVAPVFTVGIKDTYTINENTLVLDCRVRGKPRPDVQWMKGNDYLIDGDRYNILTSPDGYCKLVINNPTEKDSGLYACVARNEAAENKITHQVDFAGRERFALEKTHGYFHRDPNKPHFLVPLSNQTVCPGGTVAISAEFMKSATPLEVQWLRDRRPVAGQAGLQTFMESGVYTLAILNAQPEAEGTYTCRASNAFGRIESHVSVDVAAGVPKNERPPLFLSRPEPEMKILVGDPFSISFRIAGEPKPKLIFMKGTKDITKSDRVSKEVSDDYTRFTVQGAQIADSGTYFVVARNNFGTDRVFVTITVMPRARSETPTSPRWGQRLESFPDVSYFRDPPGPISTEPLVVDSGPTHISLSWGKPARDNSAPVIAYRVDAWIIGHEGGAIWKEFGLTPINSFDAFNLKPNLEYHFRVTPKNRYGWGPSVQTSSPLQVGGAECLPEFVKILSGQLKALLGKPLTLECTVRGAPRPQIDWYKDGMHISPLAERIRMRQIGSTCTLIIAPTTELDAGRYTCEATNSKGRVSTFARLQIVTDPRLYEADTKLKEIIHYSNVARTGDALPIFTMRLRDRRVQMTYPVRLTCQVMGYPAPEVNWFKDEQQIVESRRCLITDDGQFHTLELASTLLDDSGIYTCTAKNELGSVSCHCSLVVDKGIRAYISPEFYMPLDPLYIYQEGQEIRVTAKVEAYPTVGVSWHRNGVRLRPSRRIGATLDANGFVELVIANATQHDAGIYVCVASNAVGKVESSCRVIIEEPDEDEKQHQGQRGSSQIPTIVKCDLPYSKEPMFVVKPRSSEAYEGDTVIIFCEVVGDPKPDVVWLRDFLNPEYYKDAPHFRPVGDGPEYRLEIPSAKLDFTGTYSVIASNCHGEAKAVISLQIYAKDILNNLPMEKGSIRHGNVETLPRFIRHLRNLRCCDGDAITLECNVEALPEPIIIWEKDGHVLSSSKDFTMFYDGIKATLSIPRIYPEDEGEYTCVAKNNLGRTLSSACIIVDVPEEKENMLNRQLKRPNCLLSASSTPRSTPRSTPNRGYSPRRLSYRSSQIDLSDGRIGSYRRALLDSCTMAAPKFLAIPHSRVVEEGDSVRFQCAIAGHPTPWSTWDREGMIVTPTARIAVKEVDDLRFLEIDEVTFDDAGLYRITLENDYGRIEATARLDVIGRSRYSRSPSVRSVRACSSRRNAHLHRRIMGPSTAIGGRMALATGYRGSSVPSCKFYHNGVELEEDDERVHIIVNEHEALLCIDNVTEADEGAYTCIIQGDHEPLLTSTWVKFESTEDNAMAARMRAPRILRSLPAQVEACERETIDLSFELDCDEPYEYIWKRNGEYLPDDEDFNQIDHGNGIICLRIKDAFDLDSGEYACEVRTAAALTCSTACQLCVVDSEAEELTLFAQPEYQPILLKSPLPVLTHAGAAEVAFCARVYPPEATVRWFVCGREIADSEDEEPHDSLDNAVTKTRTAHLSNEPDGIRVLRIQNVQQRHCGEVQLSVTHLGKQSSTLRAYTSLIVLPGRVPTHEDKQQGTSDKTIEALTKHEHEEIPACILEGPQDCTALIGGKVKLNVSYEAVPRAQVSWFKGCRPIVEQRNISIRTSAKRSTLLITDIVADDSGKYTVEIMNALGSDAAAASVAVEGPPDAPSGKPSISQGPDRIAVAWCGPPYDGGCMITGFIIEMQQISADLNIDCNILTDGESDWREIATVVDSLAYTVKNLTPNAMYRFRVRAKNVHGCSAPSLPSDAVELQAQEVSTEDFHRTITVKSGGDFKSRFEILEELGKGRFGIVYRVQEREEPRQILAAKVIKCIKSQDRQKVLEEISIMKSLKHPKLLQLAASFESPREIVMVMEYITGGELFERVVADDFTLTERDCILFLRQVCEGVAYMHTQAIVHLDLKPENIMCHTRTSHQIKIIDFGLAQRLNTSAPLRVLFGTPEFIPPEIINYEPIGFQSDMWSVGVICYVLLSGLSPFMGDTDVDTFTNITRADYDFDDEAFDCVSQEAKDFISNLLVHRKEKRLTAVQCLESKWLTQEHDENLSNKICTDKLKKFIIRRKWQKTGNAIRALGRMATLSASRRNSAASNAGSVSNSPRPSISGLHHMYNPHNCTQMGSLHEEDDDFSIEPNLTTLEAPRRYQKTLKVRDKSQCSERSDSGYSECSNCSASGNLPCHCTAAGVSSVSVIVEHSTSDDLATKVEANGETLLSVGVPHEVLKSKLEEIAQQTVIDCARSGRTGEELRHMSVDELSECSHQAKLEPATPATDKYLTNDACFQALDAVEPTVPVEQPLSISPPLLPHVNVLDTTAVVVSPPLREPIMRSDFTNTVKMRKKSLENNALREKPKQQSKPLLEAAGKVSQLKNKFNNASDENRGPRVKCVSDGKKSSAKSAHKRNSPPTPPSGAREHKNALDVRVKHAASKSFASNSSTTTTSATTKSTISTLQQQQQPQQKHLQKPQCTSVPNSPLLGRTTTTPLRISSRVREATERLAQQQTVATSARRIEARR